MNFRIKQLFREAEERKPSIIVFDNLDNMLKINLDDSQDADRRTRTEFLVQFQTCRHLNKPI